MTNGGSIDPMEIVRFMMDQHEGERSKLSENEAFAIGMLQAVCAATAFGIVSQIRTLNKIAGAGPVLVVLSALIVGLVAAVVSAFFRHQYKMWDVKASATLNDNTTKAKRAKWSDRNLGRMRHCMLVSVVLLVLSLAILVAAMLVTFLARPA